jgi:mannan endo-1,4-beta-mannosidase
MSRGYDSHRAGIGELDKEWHAADTLPGGRDILLIVVVDPPRQRIKPRAWAAAALALVAALVAVAGLRADSSSGRSSPVPLSRHVALGAYTPGLPDDLTSLHALDATLGRKLRIASSYSAWGDPVIDAGVRQEVAQGYVPLISWNIAVSPAQRYAAIASGAGDVYLARVADAARRLGHTVYVRPWPEMNLTIFSYQPTPSGSPGGGTPAEFIAAWQHLVTLFRKRGAHNVRWVFDPTADTYAGTTPVSTIWPGSAYVNTLGLDEYNWGEGGGKTWQSFHDVFAAQYAQLVALDPRAPVWICEFGSKEPTENDGAPIDPLHSKAQWYRDLLADTSFGHVAALVMFDVNKERDWRIGSDPGAVAAVRAAVPT